MRGLFRPAGKMARRHRQHPHQLDLRVARQAQLMAVALDRMGAVAQLEVMSGGSVRARGQDDAEEIKKARLGVPALAAAGAIALAPEHIGLRNPLHMPAVMAIEPVVRPPRGAIPEPFPAKAPRLGGFAGVMACLAAQPGLAFGDPFDQLELARQDMPAGCAKPAIAVPVRIGAEEGDARRRSHRAAPGRQAMRAQRLAAHQREQFGGDAAAAGPAAQLQVIAVADAGDEVKALRGGGCLPMRMDRAGEDGRWVC